MKVDTGLFSVQPSERDSTHCPGKNTKLGVSCSTNQEKNVRFGHNANLLLWTKTINLN